MIDTLLIPLAIGISLIVLNFAGLTIAHYFGTMVFLDTVGTAMAGMAFGPWQGALIGLLTNVVIGALLFRSYLKFAYVNVICGFAWGLIGNTFP
jgi:energy-coupling factor transport system substrate-specific component